MRGRTKIFCIGENKTGTTSLAKALRDLGYLVGNQARAERLIEDWAQRNFSPIVGYCGTAEAFQDVPFFLPDTYQALDAAFPGSKFILTVRDSAEAWYDSLTRFHAQRFGTQGLPTEQQLANSEYRYPGFVLRAMKLKYGDVALYDRDVYIQQYNTHNSGVQQYFAKRQQDLLVLNVAAPDAYSKLCEFLGLPATDAKFPHLNRSNVATP